MVSFSQSQWLKPYIEFNTQKRQESNNTIEKTFWKLVNNCIYGKFIENKRKRQRIVLVSSEQRALRYNRKPSVQSILTLSVPCDWKNLSR